MINKILQLMFFLDYLPPPKSAGVMIKLKSFELNFYEINSLMWIKKDDKHTIDV